MKIFSIKASLFSLTAFLTLATTAAAQNFDEQPARVRLPYAYPYTIEFGLGHSRNLKSYSDAIPDKGLSGRADNHGFDINIRFTWFFTKHWGAFAALNAANYNVRAKKTEAALEDFYGAGRYRYYNLIREEWDCSEEYNDGGGASGAWYLAGPTYRYDLGHWSFRGRLGLGIGDICPHNARYLRVDGETVNLSKTPEYQRVDLLRNKDDKFSSNLKTFAYSPSIQVTFTPRSHVFFSFEASFIGNVGHHYERIETYTMKETDKNGGWFGDLIHCVFFPWAPDFTPEYEGAYYKKDQLIDRQFHRVHPDDLLSFNLGIGWNIGWNRNERK